MSNEGNVSETASAAGVAKAKSGLGRRALLGAAAAAVILGGIAIFGPGGNSGTTALDISSVSDVTELSGTLASQDAAQFLADARACKVPLAHLQMWHQAGMPDSVVQVRSGNYVSPAFRLTTTPERIAIPFPAPYPSGSGDLAVLGNAQGVAISLHPTVHFANVNGSASIHVVWQPGNPCQ